MSMRTSAAVNVLSFMVTIVASSVVSPAALAQVTSPDASALPYAVRRAAQSFPVVLYTTAGCAPCDSGRALLRARGVPYSERTVNTGDDLAALRAAGLDTRFPVLAVGASSVAEFEPDVWQKALTVAGYPEQSQLPPAYLNPPAAPLAPARRPEPGASSDRSPASASPPARAPTPAPGSAPPGFRF